jgi:hypothetical protein
MKFFVSVFNVVSSIAIHGGLICLLYLQCVGNITPQLHNLLIFCLIFYTVMLFGSDITKVIVSLWGASAIEKYNIDTSPAGIIAARFVSSVFRGDAKSGESARNLRVKYVENLAANKDWFRRKLTVGYASLCLVVILILCVMDGYIKLGIFMVLCELFFWKAVDTKISRRSNKPGRYVKSIGSIGATAHCGLQQHATYLFECTVIGKEDICHSFNQLPSKTTIRTCFRSKGAGFRDQF